jgi:hypothetical protein
LQIEVGSAERGTLVRLRKEQIIAGVCRRFAAAVVIVVVVFVGVTADR